MLAYTIGHRASYDEGLRETEPLKKVGASPAYPGGGVWATPEEAAAFLQTEPHGIVAEDFSVYELELPKPWDECVSKEPVDGVLRLLEDAVVKRRVDL